MFVGIILEFDLDAIGKRKMNLLSMNGLIALFASANCELTEITRKKIPEPLSTATCAAPSLHTQMTTPPGQTTNPVDAKFSGESTQSGGTDESKHENYSDIFTLLFLKAALHAFRDQLDLSWINENVLGTLDVKYTLHSRNLILRKGRMKMKLGVEIVTAHNDGGLEFQRSEQFEIPPLLSFEVVHSVFNCPDIRQNAKSIRS